MLNASAINAIIKSSETTLPQVVTYTAVEKKLRTKVSFGRSMIRALELQHLAKKHISVPSDIK